MAKGRGRHQADHEPSTRSCGKKGRQPHGCLRQHLASTAREVTLPLSLFSVVSSEKQEAMGTN